MMNIEIYTDGACNQMKDGGGAGGWSFIILENGEPKLQKSGALINTTNNKSEMWAAIHAIKAMETMTFSEPITVTLYSDSAYLVNAFVQDWFAKWKKNGWINSSKEPVLNRELWEQLIELQNKFSVKFVQIKRCSNKFAKKVDSMAKRPIT